VTTKKSSKKTTIPYQGESLPYDSDSEKGVLSCFLHDPANLIPEAELTIPDEHFYHPAHQCLFKEMKEMHANGRPVEYIAITNWLRDKGILDRIGGAGTLSELLNFVPTPAHFPYYRGILKDKWLFRKGITLCTESVSEAYSFGGEDASVWTEKLAAEALQLHNAAVQQGGIHQGCDLDQAGAEMERRGKQVGIPTPFPWFNRKFGGCFPGTLILFGGSRGIGKSALTRQIAWYTAGKLKEPTEVISFEMDRVQEFRRICSLEGVDNSAWLREDGTLTEYEQQIVDRVRRAAKHIPLKIHDDVSTLEQTVSRIRMGFLKRKSRVWIVDGPQALEEDSKETRERVLSRMGKTLKAVAKENQLCIICPVHLNDDGDARGSKDLENFCDLFARMGRDHTHKPTMMEPWQRILVRLSKNRNGPEEDEGLLLRFTGKHLRFEEESTTSLNFVQPAQKRK
jgi:replicative DNA helicase